MSLFKTWDKFWFSEVGARQYALLRIAIGGLSAIYLIQLLPYCETQFSADGWLGNIRQIDELNGGSWSLLFLQVGAYNKVLAYMLVSVGVLSSIALMLGCYSRCAALVSWLVLVSLWNRNPLLLDGDDALLKIMCFYLMLSPCGKAWSFDVRFNKISQKVEVWPLRLIQCQIALIYFVSGWVKFQSPEWDDGSAISYVLIHPHYARWDGWTVINKPYMAELFALLANLIRWWEVMFPFLLLNSTTRKLSLMIGIFFHLGLLLTMNLRGFAVLMLALYPALLSNREFQRLEAGLIRRLA